MEQEDAEHAVAEDAAEGKGLAFGQIDEPQNKTEKEHQDNGAAHEAVLLADGAEDEVGVLFGHIFQLRLRAVEKTFAVESAGTDGYFALAHVVAGTVDILFQSQKDAHAFLLVGLKHVVEHVIGGIVGEERAEGEHGDKGQPRKALAQAFDDQIDHDAHTESQLHPGNVERLNIA